MLDDGDAQLAFVARFSPQKRCLEVAFFDPARRA
jgi:hypothetical protein